MPVTLLKNTGNSTEGTCIFSEAASQSISQVSQPGSQSISHSVLPVRRSGQSGQSVGWPVKQSVGRLVGWSVGRSVGRYFDNHNLL